MIEEEAIYKTTSTYVIGGSASCLRLAVEAIAEQFKVGIADLRVEYNFGKGNEWGDVTIRIHKGKTLFFRKNCSQLTISDGILLNEEKESTMEEWMDKCEEAGGTLTMEIK